METTLLRTPTKYPHIELDHKGRPVIAGTDYRVSMVVQDVFGVNAYSPEKVVEQFPELSLARVHMALAYYHDHKTEIDAAIERERQFFEDVRANNRDPDREKKILERGIESGRIRS